MFTLIFLPAKSTLAARDMAGTGGRIMGCRKQVLCLSLSHPFKMGGVRYEDILLLHPPFIVKGTIYGDKVMVLGLRE